MYIYQNIKYKKFNNNYSSIMVIVWWYILWSCSTSYNWGISGISHWKWNLWNKWCWNITSLNGRSNYWLSYNRLRLRLRLMNYFSFYCMIINSFVYSFFRNVFNIFFLCYLGNYFCLMLNCIVIYFLLFYRYIVNFLNWLVFNTGSFIRNIFNSASSLDRWGLSHHWLSRKWFANFWYNNY